MPTETVVLPTAAIIITDDQTTVIPADAKEIFLAEEQNIIKDYDNQKNISFSGNANELVFIMFIDMSDDEMNEMLTSDKAIETLIVDLVGEQLINRVKDVMCAEQFIVCLNNTGNTFMAYNIFSDELAIEFMDTAVG